jgi:diacylglycerol kinase family enzyme
MRVRQAAAIGALVLGFAGLALAVVVAAQEFPRGPTALACVCIGAAGAWYGLLRRGALRGVGLSVGALGFGAGIVMLLGDRLLEAVLVVAAFALSVACARAAFGGRADLPRVAAPRRPVLVFNPRSGGGKAERFSLASEARARGIEPIELGPGGDLETIVRNAVAAGADGLAMAGGDGSQAIVAAIAAELDLPYACVPAGTRNHFALDLGVDRDDVVGALDAFVDGRERRVDLAEVNGRVFVNNVSIGLYADAVQREGYRDAKLRTLRDTVPDVLGPAGADPDLRWTGPGGQEHRSAAAILVSNNRYRLGRAVGSGTRPRIDDGLLGITVAGALEGPRLAREPAAAPVAGVDRTVLRARSRPPGARRHRRRGGDAGAASPLRDPPRRPARAHRAPASRRLAVGDVARELLRHRPRAVAARRRARSRGPRAGPHLIQRTPRRRRRDGHP